MFLILSSVAHGADLPYEIDTVALVFEARVRAVRFTLVGEVPTTVYALDVTKEHAGNIASNQWVITVPFEGPDAAGSYHVNPHVPSFGLGEELLVFAEIAGGGVVSPFPSGIFSRLPRADGTPGAYYVREGGFKRHPVQTPCDTTGPRPVVSSRFDGWSDVFVGYQLDAKEICSWDSLIHWAERQRLPSKANIAGSSVNMPDGYTRDESLSGVPIPMPTQPIYAAMDAMRPRHEVPSTESPARQSTD